MQKAYSLSKERNDLPDDGVTNNETWVETSDKIYVCYILCTFSWNKKEVIVSYFIFEVQVFVCGLLNNISSASVYRVSIAGPRQIYSRIAGTFCEIHYQILPTFYK